ncbi:MAG: hypothetical protein M2R45_01808 [Verrucomicrobia subdivision 3 bacterium]|nr:hypothetical protein [Limisphaerales bacterium]MCS1415837.1 hypothetical protein [Limisphaerales bacterium]
MSDIRRLVFCFPYRGVGGVSLLFLRVAERLAAEYDQETYLVDYPDGFMAKHRDTELTRFIAYRDGSRVSVPEESLVIFQAMTPWSIFPALRIPSETRILYWNCYPFNLIPSFPGLTGLMFRSPVWGRLILTTLLISFRNKMLRLINLMLEKESLVFHDSTNVAVTEQYLMMKIADPVFLPVTAGDPPKEVLRPSRDLRAQGLRVAWIGRVCDFKYFILKHAITKLEEVAETLSIPLTVTIVGSGDYTAKLHRHADSLERNTIRFIEHISPGNLDEYLCQEVDLLLAMGASALEGARLGVPTILVDIFYRDVPDNYVFRWLCDRTGFTLGAFQPKHQSVDGNHSLSDRVRELLNDSDLMAARTSEYFQQHHSLDSVCNRLLRIADRAICSYGELCAQRLTERGVLYPIYRSIKKTFSES